MNILYGLYHPDEGEIVLRGEPVASARPRTRSRRGIGMVHQHFMLVPVFTVTENIVLGQRDGRPARSASTASGGRADVARALAGRYRPRRAARGARRGSAGRRAAARRDRQGALPRGRVLILDEPTAVLTPQETDELFAVIRALASAGHVGHLHQPQAARGAARSPTAITVHAARQGRRQHHAGRADRAGAGRR